MARIRTERKGDRTVVIVAGRLAASDMRRLEHACSAALITERPRLEIDLRGVTFTDNTAAALVRQIVERGAVLKTPIAR